MKQSIHLPIIIEQDEDGIFIVSCNSFKGCHSQGKTIEIALQNIKEVISICMEEQNDLEPINQFIGFRELEIAI